MTSGSGTGGGMASGACPSTEVVPTPLRRLTKFQYANAVRDLLGVDPAPVAGLPADEVSGAGFNDDAQVLTVSSLHAEKYVLVSEALASAAVQKLSALTTCDTKAKGEDACALDFAKKYGRRAFRRPTTSDDEKLLMAAYSAGRTDGSYQEGIEVMIRAMLQSPDFLYRLETTTPSDTKTKLVPLSQYELAARLSFLLWASGPDDALLDDAGNGKLGSRDAVATRARAMLADPKARTAITDFYNQWVGTSRLDIITKNNTLYPSFSDDVRAGMAQELPAFVEHVLWSGSDHSLTQFLTEPVAFVTPALAKVYGVSAPGGSGSQMVSLPANQNRAGILTQAGFLAVQAHPDQTSPVLRGKFVRSKLMCQPPPPPPMDVNITLPAVTAAATARQRLSAHLTAASSCMGCHIQMDPIGLTFENFDAVGQYRTKEGNADIDVSGEIIGARDGSLGGAFSGVKELANKLAASSQVRDCVAEQWYDFAIGRSEDAADGCSLSTLQKTFAASNGNLADLIVGMTQTDAFWYRAPYTQ
ncbi:MAG TPA: DUF1592 domain-containing protein [Polyangia bacterium]|nr:DUF1592 domain-containing protein [Polyangia bacterium]